MKTLALTKPAKFFSNYFDPSRLSTNTAGNQIDTETGIRKTLATAKYHSGDSDRQQHRCNNKISDSRISDHLSSTT